MKEKKLILFDLDGTLIDWRQAIIQPSTNMVKILERLRAHGFLVMVASGRLLPLITMPLEKFNCDGYLLSDGAHVILDSKELVCKPLKYKDVEAVKRLAKANSLEYGLLFKDGAYLKRAGVIEPFLQKACFEMDKVSYHDQDGDTFKIYLHCPKDKQAKICAELGAFNLAFEDDYELIEIRNKECSKASGLKMILEQVKVKQENTYFFGDGFNDLEIFKMVGHPYVMANADQSLYQYGTVCKRVEEDGVFLKVQEILEMGI